MAPTLNLTFDDGPNPAWTPRVLAELDRHDARATFFVTGANVRAHPDLVESITRAGHQIGLHCDRHIRHSELDETQIDADCQVALATLAELGVEPALWRTPWGVRTQDTERVAARLELELVAWSIDTHDWRGDPAPRMLACASIDGLADGGIVLMHDGLGPGARREGCANTVALIAPIVAFARERELAVTALEPALDGLAR